MLLVCDSLEARVCWVRGIKMGLIEGTISRISEVNLESIPGAEGSIVPLLLLGSPDPLFLPSLVTLLLLVGVSPPS